MARNLDDVLARRTRALIQNARAAAEAAPLIAALLAPELGWTEEQAAAEARDFAVRALDDLRFAGLPDERASAEAP